MTRLQKIGGFMNTSPIQAKTDILSNLISEVEEYERPDLTKVVQDFHNQPVFWLADVVEQGFATLTRIGQEEIERVFELVAYEVGFPSCIWNSYEEFEEFGKPQD